jgi:hypothetical protein
MQKVKFHTITIKVPAEQVLLSKTGKITLVPTFTKTGAITKRKGEPAIIFEPDSYIIHPEIVNQGDVYNNEVSESKKVRQKKEKKETVKKETVKKQTLQISPELQAKLDKGGILKFGDIENNNIHFEEFKDPDPFNTDQQISNVKKILEKYIRYYFDNAYKILPKQSIPSDSELADVGVICKKLSSNDDWTTQFVEQLRAVTNMKMDRSKVVFSFPVESLSIFLSRITKDDYKILMKIAYNDGINNNKKYYNKAIEIYNGDSSDDE